MADAREVIAARLAKWQSGLSATGCLADADSILAALHSAGYVVERGWCSDMDAAPRDGTEVLAVGGTMETPDTVWWNAEGAEMSHCWWNNASGSERPTHWRPLPAPPAAETEGEG